MPKIKELPALERPREKCLRYGVESLSDEELLALIIGSGYKGKNAKDVAYEILSNINGLSGLTRVTYKGFVSYKGISKVKAITLSSLVEIMKRIQRKNSENTNQPVDNNYLHKIYKTYLKDMTQEVFMVICLDYNKRIIHEEILFKGSESSLNISIKEIIRILLDYNSRFFYIIHNHPSGLSSPSNEDILFTKNLIKKTNALNIPLMDHLILAKDEFTSIKNSFLKNV